MFTYNFDLTPILNQNDLHKKLSLSLQVNIFH
jgi:hypothetical protein